MKNPLLSVSSNGRTGVFCRGINPVHEGSCLGPVVNSWNLKNIEGLITSLFMSYSKLETSLTTHFCLSSWKMLKKTTFSLVSSKLIECFPCDLRQVDLIFPSLVSIFKIS